jgi:hypothetical protein
MSFTRDATKPSACRNGRWKIMRNESEVRIARSEYKH